MKHFTHTNFTLGCMVPESFRRDYRPTVSIIMIDRDDVLFVQPSKDPARKSWILPQGGIARFERIIEAVNREVHEELGVVVHDASSTMLGQYVNPLPPEREEQRPKFMVCVALRGRFPPAFKLNHENIDFKRVGNPYDLWNLMAGMVEQRPKKFLGTCHALNEAHKRSMLSWSCAPILEQVENRSAA